MFDRQRKEIVKWLKICEKKEKEIPNDVEDLDEALNALKLFIVCVSLFYITARFAVNFLVTFLYKICSWIL